MIILLLLINAINLAVIHRVEWNVSALEGSREVSGNILKNTKEKGKKEEKI